MVQAALTAFPADFRYPGRFTIDLNAANDRPPPAAPPPLTEIHDARPLQASMSAAELFDRHGFALLPHATAVTDWDADPATGYRDEVEHLIAMHLLPGRRFRVSFGAMNRRGRDTPQGYALGVHQDCGYLLEDYQQLVGAYSSPEAAQGWRAVYDADDVDGYVLINFWRTTHMRGPLRHMPLTICDPQSVALDDIVPTELLGLPGTRVAPYQMALRRNPDQCWYYYPDMTTDEVLAFKLFDSRKSDGEPRLRSCFHTAFVHPDTPADAEHRQSCEYRLGIWLLKD